MTDYRGTANYHNPVGGYGGPAPSNAATNDPSPLDALREQTSKIEDLVDTLAEPIKPYVSSTILRHWRKNARLLLYLRKDVVECHDG